MADVTTSVTELTFDEFVQRYGGKRYEYVDGRAVPMGPEMAADEGEVTVGPTKLVHGIIVGRIASIIEQFVYERKLGVVLGAETGFLMQKDPPELRAADVAFVSRERLQAVDDLGDWLPFPPDLAVEVIPEWDKAAEMRRRARRYVTSGTRLLWFVYPQDREVEVYRPGQPVQTLGPDDTLDGGDVLPGFSVAVTEVFAALDTIAGED
jgi:Uma2 family endonuclease